MNLTKTFKKIWWAVKLAGARIYYRNPAKKLKIVGVTGTNGKTTTATLLYKIATQLGYKAGLVSTVENRIGEEVRAATHTTPDSISLMKLFAEMAEKGCEYVFMEVSSHALDQNRVAGIPFTGGIFTNLTHDHLDYHKTIENYFKAKKKFFQMLSKESFALANGDDEYGPKMLKGIVARPFLHGYSSFFPQVGHVGADYKGEIVKMDFSGLHLKFNGEDISAKLLGKFNAYNLLAVWSASKLLGFDMVKVKTILENITPPAGRFEHFNSPNGVLVIVDYAHTPDALKNVLMTASSIKPAGAKLISVFGCGGDRDPSKRPVMGKMGAEMSDIAIFTSDNPRSEDPEMIIAEMKKHIPPELLSKVQTNSNRREAIAQALALAKPGDIILCAGKGHETYQEIKGVKSHFSDVEEFQKLFK